MTAAPASSVTLDGPPDVEPNAVSGAFTLTAREANTTSMTVVTNEAFGLSSNSSGISQFSTNADGSGVITSVTILNGASSATFYYTDDTSGDWTITAADGVDEGAALGNATHDITVLTTSAVITGSTNTTEATLNSATIDIDIVNGSFISVPSGLDGADFVLNGAPAGVTIEPTVIRHNANSVTISLDYDGTDFDVDQHISVSILASGLQTGAPATTGTITVTPAPADHLAFIQQPTSAVAGVAIAPAVTVAVQDQFGHTRTSDNTTTITLAIGANPGSGTLSGTFAAVQVTNGVATFSDLSIDKVGTGYTLVASSTPSYTVPTATSSVFDITPAALDHFTISTISSTQASNTDITVDVTAQDAFDNTVTAFDGTGNNVVITATNSVSVTVGSPSADFTAGVLTGHIIQMSTLLSTGTEVVVTGGGKTGTSNTFTLAP